MDEYRTLQKQRHAEWKRQEDSKNESIRRQQEEEELKQQRVVEKKAQDTFITNEVEVWIKEGFDPEDAYNIAINLLNTHLTLKHQTVQYVHPIQTVPKLFGVCATAGQTYYFFDLRLLMDQIHYTTITTTPQLFNLGVTLDESSWTVLNEYWTVVNPYKYIQYRSRQLVLRVKSIDIEPDDDTQIQSYVSTICLDESKHEKTHFDQDQYYGAFSVSLPPIIMDPLLDQMAFSSERSTIAVELCIPGVSPRVFAYCRNPDETSDNDTVGVPWRLKHIMNAFDDQNIFVRILDPPIIPKSPTPALRVVSVVTLPETISSTILKQSFNESLNHQRVVFPGQTILVHVDGVFGPIPFMVAQVYTESLSDSQRRPVGVVSVYGHGDGIDCVVETVHEENSESTTGFEKYYNYLSNLKKRRLSFLPPSLPPPPLSPPTTI